MNFSIFKRKKKEKKKKGFFREWFDAILFAVVAATIIRWLLIEAFTIPTPSMEKSLLVGDFLFVSKMHYGARAPKTPLQIPLTHQKIWFTELPSYSKLIQLPYFRLPGFSKIKNNDVVVFNNPPETQYPTDLKTNYIKRCVAISGDVLEIKDKTVLINGKALADKGKRQTSFFVNTKKAVSINERVFRNLDINLNEVVNVRPGVYSIQTTREAAQKLEKLNFIESVTEVTYARGTESERVFPLANGYDWSLDNFGPLKIPKKGAQIKVTQETMDFYGNIISQFEGHKDVRVEAGKLWIDGNQISDYTFTQNYYFMMGDNRHDSLDSRIWGFVPEDHILGKGLLIWFSMAPPEAGGNMFERIRWRRIFKLIE